MKKKLVLGVLFFLPVMFLLIMLSSKHYYTPLDVVKSNVEDVSAFTVSYDTAVTLKKHITVLMVFNEDPVKHIPEISNVNEKAYKWAKGYRGFQVVLLFPETYRASENTIREKLGEYVDLSYWRFVTTTDAGITNYFKMLTGGVDNKTFQYNNHFYIIDKDLNMRGRKEDDGNGTLYGYDARSIAELQKKVVSDLRILFQEYRDKRKGDFDSDQRRLKELKHEE